MSGITFARLFAACAMLLSALSWTLPASAQQSSPRHFVARAEDPANPGVYVLVGWVVDPDGWAMAAAASNDDAWNRDHARIFRGRVIDNRFTGLAGDGTVAVAELDGTTIRGTVGMRNYTATLQTGGSAGVWVGGNRENIVLVLEASDGTMVGRVLSRANGEHKETLLLSMAGANSGDGSRLLSADGRPLPQGTYTISNGSNGTRNITNSAGTSYTTGWCSNSFCSGSAY